MTRICDFNFNFFILKEMFPSHIKQMKSVRVLYAQLDYNIRVVEIVIIYVQ